jgi:hypothetical protein
MSPVGPEAKGISIVKQYEAATQSHDCDCHYCGAPIYRGESATIDTYSGKGFCDKGCARSWEAENPCGDEPSPEDYVISCNGFRLSIGIVEGPFIGEYAEDEDAEDAVREHRKRTSPDFYPNVWRVSDHGNVSLADGWSWEGRTS